MYNFDNCFLFPSSVGSWFLEALASEELKERSMLSAGPETRKSLSSVQDSCSLDKLSCKLDVIIDVLLFDWFVILKLRATNNSMSAMSAFTGVCLGMQLAVCEFARNVIGWQGNTAVLL